MAIGRLNRLNRMPWIEGKAGALKQLPLGKPVLLSLLVLILAILGGALFSINRGLVTVPLAEQDVASPGSALIPGVGSNVSELEFPATLVLRSQAADVASANRREAPVDNSPGVRRGASVLSLNQPSDAVSLDGQIYVLDTGNGRLVEHDASGQPIRALDASVDERLALQLPMAMAVHQDSLYIADSGSHRLVVVNPSQGKVEQVIDLEKMNEGEALPRPIGIAVAPNGDVFASDADNQRVIRYSADGGASSFVGTGRRDAGEYGLNTPGSLALDGEGNLFVVDILNSRVMKYSPDGKFLLQIGERGDTAGTFSRPKGVAVDHLGNVYVSDSLLAAVQVFDRRGKYLGLIGRNEAGNKESDSVFQAPADLMVEDGRLYVTDRLAGVFVFDLGR